MTGKTICVLSDSCAAPVVSGIQKFRDEFDAYIAGARRPRARRRMSADVTVTIDGMPVSVPAGHDDHRGGQAGGRAGAALLLPPVAAVAGGLPDVPGGGGEGARS